MNSDEADENGEEMKRERPASSPAGRIEKAEQVCGLTLLECRYRPDLRMPEHWHDYAHFVVVLEGACTDTCRTHLGRYGSPHLLFYPAGEPHTSVFHQTGTRTFEIQMKAEWLKTVRDASVHVDEPRDFAGGLPVWLGMRLYREFREMDAVAPLAIQGLTLELLAETSRHHVGASERQPPRWLRRAREILEAQLTDGAALASIAETVGVHPVHLARGFRQHYRCTVGEYIRTLRVSRACDALSSSDASVTDIAMATGFSDHSHLCKTFKRHMGLTPTEFRRQFGGR